MYKTIEMTIGLVIGLAAAGIIIYFVIRSLG